MSTANAPVQDYAFFPAFNNKIPSEGPRYIPMTFAFDTYSTWEVDMTIIQQQGKISTLQAFYIDNSANTNALSITMGLGAQTIDVPAGAQGYVTVLVNNVPKFSVTSIQAAGQVANVFALNFPVTNAVWETVASGGGSGGNVNLTEVGGATIALGQTTMADSLPVVLASNQTPVEINLTQVSGDGLLLGQQTMAGSVPVVLASNQSTVDVLPTPNAGSISYLLISSGNTSASVAAPASKSLRYLTITLSNNTVASPADVTVTVTINGVAVFTASAPFFTTAATVPLVFSFDYSAAPIPAAGNLVITLGTAFTSGKVELNALFG